MHRFYTVHSFRSFNRAQVATASIFLAAKVEEQPRKLEHVAKVSYSCQNRDAPMLDTHSETYTELIEAITYHELLILETLGFEVAVDHPHPHVVKCMHLLRASKDLSQTAYFMAHNSLLLTTFCLEHKPTVVACVCIHLACRWKGLEIPRSSDNKGWWEYVDSGITLEQLNSLTKEFLMIYEKCPSRLQKKITEPMKVMQQQQSKSSSGDQPSTSSSSSRPPHTSTEKGKAPAGTHSLPRKHKTVNPSTAPSHAHAQSSHKPSSHPPHQQHTKHTNPSHPNFTTGQKSHDTKHHGEHPPHVSSKQHSSSHSLLPPLTHSGDRSRSSSPLPPGKLAHKHHHHHSQGSSSKLPEFGGKHLVSGGGSASKMVGGEQKQKTSKHRSTNPNHDSLRKPEQQKVAFKRSHSGENPEHKRPRIERPPPPPPSSFTSMPPLPPLPTELDPPPPPPSREPQNLLKGHQFQMPSLATQRSTSFPPLPSVPTLPPLPPPLPSPDNEFPPPPPPPPR